MIPTSARVERLLTRAVCTVFPANAALIDRSTRDQQLNDIILWTLKRTDIAATKEPRHFVRGDGKRPDGITLVPWQDGRCLTWDTTIVDTLAASYVEIGSTVPAGTTNAAAARNHVKYDTISVTISSYL